MSLESRDLPPRTWNESERPLSAFVAQMGEVTVAFTEEPATRRARLLAPEEHPGVRDVDRELGVVRMDSGKTVSLARFLGRDGLRASLEGR